MVFVRSGLTPSSRVRFSPPNTPDCNASRLLTDKEMSLDRLDRDGVRLGADGDQFCVLTL